MHRPLYRSDMDLPGTEAAIEGQVTDIVRRPAARNLSDDLTGALLHVRHAFIQALEGPLPALEATFERICCDLRHRRVELLEFVQADCRIFGDWTMVRITPNRTIEKLLAAPRLVDEPVQDLISPEATIQLMRTLLLSGAAKRGEQYQRRAIDNFNI